MQSMNTIENVIREIAHRIEIGSREVVVLRGVSGAGKSTLAKRLVAAVPGARSLIVSADDFFVGIDGRYHFDPQRLGEAHAVCLRRYWDAVVQGRMNGDLAIHSALVIVDNTNTTIAELAPYMGVALSAGWRATLLTVPVPVAIAAARNVHGVGPQSVEAQMRRLEEDDYGRMPPYWDKVTLYPGSTVAKEVA